MSLFSTDSLKCSNEGVYQFLFNLYNVEAKKYNLSKALRLTNMRKMMLSRFVNDYTMGDLFVILREMRKAKKFITGSTWFDFDWIIDESNVVKLMEGKYRDDKFSYKKPATIESKAQYTERKF